MIFNSAEILSVGTEILIGDIVNTDAAFISKRLAALGISQYYQAAVGDNCGRLKAHMEEALDRCGLLILTGGLGPTYDDLTKETAASVMGRKLVMHEESLERIKDFFARIHPERGMTPNNEKQAMLPEGAVVFRNDHGTAPGCAVVDEERGKAVVMLPGPPRELQPMWLDGVEPWLARFTDHILYSKNVGICGLGESAVEDILHGMMVADTNPTVAPYCGEGDVRLRVTASCKSREEGERMCGGVIAKIMKTPVGKYVYGIDADLPEAAVRLLREKGLKVSTAESCTGGLIAKRLTDVPGSSDAVEYCAVTYSERIKAEKLGVDPALIKERTVYSAEVAEAMALGVMREGGADIGIGVTGVAGPGGGTEEAPVGTVYVAAATRDGVESKKLTLTGDRQHIRHLASNHALMMIIGAAKNRG